MQLPQAAALTQGVSVVLVDYPLALEGTAKAGSDGTALLQWDAPDVDYFYRIERLTTYVIGNSASGATCSLYEGQVAPQRLRDGSNRPTLDIADESSPITIHPTMPIVIQWVGLTPGATASASVQYTLWHRRLNGGT
jgi:hypothetical protein